MRSVFYHSAVIEAFTEIDKGRRRAGHRPKHLRTPRYLQEQEVCTAGFEVIVQAALIGLSAVQLVPLT